VKKLYIHHGYNKTGTSALQDFCRQNRDALKKKGILYPTYGTRDRSAHHRLVCHFCRIPPKHFIEDRNMTDVIDEVMDELESSGADTMLVSTELMVFCADYYPEKVAAFLERFDQTRLISYLRRQDDYAHSYYNSAIRNGLCATGFDEFIDGINLDYFDNLSQWEALFGEGNIIVRPYRKDRFVGGTLHTDFLDVLGLTMDADLEELPYRPNEALSKPLVYLLQDLNRYSIRDHQGFVAYLQDFLNEQDELPEAPEYFSRQARLKMIERYRESNQQVSERWGDGEPLFEEGVSDAISEVGSYDDEVRRLSANLAVRQWNAAGNQSPGSGHNQQGLLRRAIKKLLPK